MENQSRYACSASGLLSDCSRYLPPQGFEAVTFLDFAGMSLTLLMVRPDIHNRLFHVQDAHSRLNAPQARNGAWYNLTISNGVQLSSLHLQQPLFTFKRPRPFRSTSPVPNSIPRAHYSQSLLSISPSNSIPHPA